VTFGAAERGGRADVDWLEDVKAEMQACQPVRVNVHGRIAYDGVSGSGNCAIPLLRCNFTSTVNNGDLRG